MNRYQIRNEFFGSLAYDFKQKDFIAFDKNSTKLLRTLNTNNLYKIKTLCNNEFINRLLKRQFLLEDKPNYEFLDNHILSNVIFSSNDIFCACIK